MCNSKHKKMSELQVLILMSLIVILVVFQATIKSPVVGYKPTFVAQNISDAYLVWTIGGRLGNNMFQYATSYCVAIQSRHVPTITTNNKIWRVFKNVRAQNISAAFEREMWSHAKYRYSHPGPDYDPKIVQTIAAIPHMVNGNGYMESYKYFESCADDIRQQFTIKDTIQNEAQKMMAKVVVQHLKRQNHKPEANKTLVTGNQTTSQEIITVGIHVRRMKGFQSNQAFFDHAMGYYRMKYKNVLFLICTDNTTWIKKDCKQLLSKKDAILVSENRATYEVDMAILINSNHSIVTGGTFGWWCAWLAGGEVIYDKDFTIFRKKTVGPNFDPDNFYPKNWIAL